MKKLYLGKIDRAYNKSRDIPFWAGCFPGTDDYSYDESVLMSYINSGRKYTKKNQLLVENIARYYFLPKLAIELNCLHNVNYSCKFWEPVLFNWLYLVTACAWMHFLNVREFTASHKDECFEVYVFNKKQEWRFVDTFDFYQRGMSSSLFHHWLLTRITDREMPASWKRKEQEFDIAPAIQDESIKDYRSRRCIGIKGLGDTGQIILSIILALKPAGKTDEDNFICPVLEQPDENLLKTMPESFIFIIEEIIRETMPLSFNEYFHRYNKRAKSKRYTKGKIRLTGPVNHFHEQMKYYLGHALMHGEKVICTQHGGAYGQLQSHIGAILEYNYYGFFSWGWKKHDQYKGRIYDLPSPFLQKFSDRHKFKDNKLIFVSGEINPLISTVLQSAPVNDELFLYGKEKKRFISLLDKSILRQVLFRPYPHTTGALNELQYIKKTYKDIAVCEGDLHSKILKSRLVVIDQPMTTLLIVISANIPFIGFWDKSLWKMCQQAEPLFEELEKAGVIFGNAAAAADKVNEIWPGIEKWWQQSDIQAIRKEWCFRFARKKKHWWKDWLSILWKI